MLPPSFSTGGFMNQKKLEILIEDIRKYGKRVLSSRKAALESLVKAGICTEDGKLAPPYCDGGEEP
jgi:hypothetical protein